MYAKKSLGQNFLLSRAPIHKMIGECLVTRSDTVLEIGPGKGILTRELLATGARVIAVEKDDLLIPILHETFKSETDSGQLNLIHGDILNLSTSNLQLTTNSYKLIANIPYYITGEIIRKFLESDNQPSCMALLVQKEVAERIVARDAKESILSISVKAYGTPSYGGTVKKTSFRPIPNVDSAVIVVKNINKKNFVNVTEKEFFKFVKTGFAHKRKQLGSNLKELISAEGLEKLNINPKVRAEDLKLKDWLAISEMCQHRAGTV